MWCDVIRLAAAVVVLVLLLGGCTGGQTETGAAQPSASECPVTLPTPHKPVRLPDNPLSNPGVPPDAVGNDSLWVGVSRNGVLSATPKRDRTVYWTKLGWWRVQAGQLTIKARRLDGPGVFSFDAGTVRAYGPTGFVPSGVTFSAPGCWSITGRVGDGSLTFVTRVIAARA